MTYICIDRERDRERETERKGDREKEIKREGERERESEKARDVACCPMPIACCPSVLLNFPVALCVRKHAHITCPVSCDMC